MQAESGFVCLPRPGTWTRKYRPNACREHGILPPKGFRDRAGRVGYLCLSKRLPRTRHLAAARNGSFFRAARLTNRGECSMLCIDTTPQGGAMLEGGEPLAAEVAL